jgi:hypothetical protein
MQLRFFTIPIHGGEDTAFAMSVSAVPELTTKPDGFGLNRPSSQVPARRRRNPKAPGVLVATSGCPANAHRRAALA